MRNHNEVKNIKNKKLKEEKEKGKETLKWRIKDLKTKKKGNEMKKTKGVN